MNQVKEATNACAGCSKNKICPNANEIDGFEVCEERESK
jgi:hypothetical protein